MFLGIHREAQPYYPVTPYSPALCPNHPNTRKNRESYFGHGKKRRIKNEEEMRKGEEKEKKRRYHSLTRLRWLAWKSTVECKSPKPKFFL